MERPKPTVEKCDRKLTGEIMYLDEMRRMNQFAKPYSTISEMAEQMYEEEADLYRAQGVHPAIMDLYEQNEYTPTKLELSCVAMADELLKLKEPDSRWTFIDIVIDKPSAQVLEQIESLGIEGVVASDDEQLAIESDGSYYPILDVRKKDATLVGAGLRVWGWDDDKYQFIDKNDEEYEFPKHALVYPSSEKWYRRRFEIMFSYNHPTGSFTESLSFNVSTQGGSSLSRSIWMMEYAETGYEGHDGASIEADEQQFEQLANVIAEMVGDEPVSVRQMQLRMIEKLRQTLGTAGYGQIVSDLVEASWPAQAFYEITGRKYDELGGKSIGQSLVTQIPELKAKAVEVATKLIEKYNTPLDPNNNLDPRWYQEEDSDDDELGDDIE